MRAADFGEGCDALHAGCQIVGVDHFGDGGEFALQGAGAVDDPLLVKGVMGAPAIEIVERGDAGPCPAAAGGRTLRQRFAAGLVMACETRPRTARYEGRRRCCAAAFFRPADFRIADGDGRDCHGGRHSGLKGKGGGEVPAAASSPHVLVEEKEGERLKARRRRWRAAALAGDNALSAAIFMKDAAIFARDKLSASGGMAPFPCHRRRLDPNVQGSCPRPPGGRGAVFPLPRRRCKPIRSFRDAVDNVPSFPGRLKRLIVLSIKRVKDYFPHHSND